MISLNITFIIQVINFLLLMWLLNILLFKPILKVLEERKIRIEGNKERAKELEGWVEEKKKEYQEKILKARNEGAELKNQTRREALLKEKEIIEGAQKESSGWLGEIKLKVKKEMEEEKGGIFTQAQSLSSEIAEKVLGRRLG